jgi:hypothetical protein
VTGPEKWRPVSDDGCFVVERGSIIPVAEGGGYRYRVLERRHEVRGHLVTNFSSLQSVTSSTAAARATTPSTTTGAETYGR